MSDAANARRVLMQRAKRHKAAGHVEAYKADMATVERLDAARAHYGNVVSPMALSLPPSVHDVFACLHEAGLRPLVVGGSVRDALVDGREPKDIDIEVYGAALDDLVGILGRRYKVDEVGRSFGVLKLVLDDGTDLDVSVPRRDNHVGAGHRGFEVEMDATLSVDEAASRRDYTINSVGYDPQWGVCVDPYHGRDDLKAGVLRATSEAFAEDPLRVMRGFQFAARFGFAMDPDTAGECRALLPQSTELAVERMREEWAKFYLKGRHVENGLNTLSDIGWDHAFPGLAAVNTPEVRREVAVAAAVAEANQLPEAGRMKLMAATLASHMNPRDAKAFTEHTLNGKELQRGAYGLTQATYPAERVDPVTVRQWSHTLYGQGTNITEWGHLQAVNGDARFASRVLAVAEENGCANAPQHDLVFGRDIVERFKGVRPGPWTGVVQRAARQAQIEGEFTDRASALAWLATQTMPS